MREELRNAIMKAAGPVLDAVGQFGVYQFTCSADFPEDHSITFALSSFYLSKIKESGCDVVALVPKGVTSDPALTKGVKCVECSNPRDMFFLIHNLLNEYRDPREDKISSATRIHPKAHIGADGMRYLKFAGELVSLIHMGNVVIEDGVEIGPYTGVARATIDSTTVREHARLGYGVNIGHNCYIGRRTIIVDGAVMGGSSYVGDDCWLGLNCTVRNGVRVCDRVMIGMGALVTKDIHKPGLYVGSPARRMGDWDGRW